MDKVEILILRNLLYNEEYLRKVIPFIKADYYEDSNQRIVFEEIEKFVQEYNQPATKEVLCIEVEKRQDINDTTFTEITKLISYLEDVPTDYEWLCDTTEKCFSFSVPNTLTRRESAAYDLDGKVFPYGSAR